jgi:Raf kinase inhibitor-like YbhB/YbcL family protein
VNGCLRHRLLAVNWLLILVACRGAQPTDGPPVASENGLVLTSAAFEDGGAIPTLYTCDGADTSPPLEWDDPPPNTASFALIMDDPDAPVGTWVHWVIYELPPETRQLRAELPPESQIAGGGVQGENSWPRTGYGGPCPPSGTHRYFVKLYALDVLLGASPGLTKKRLLEEMEGHILAQTQLVGTYARP